MLFTLLSLLDQILDGRHCLFFLDFVHGTDSKKQAMAKKWATDGRGRPASPTGAGDSGREAMLCALHRRLIAGFKHQPHVPYLQVTGDACCCLVLRGRVLCVTQSRSLRRAG